MKLKIGDVVTTAVHILGCNPGTRGVVVSLYNDFDIPEEHGATIIFENGNYDGFSFEEQHWFLDECPDVRVPEPIRNYKFENVMKLSNDFKKGVWDEIFR